MSSRVTNPDDYVMDFLRALYPDHYELVAATFDEEDVLREATRQLLAARPSPEVDAPEPVAWRYREAVTGGDYSRWRYYDDPYVVIPACDDGPYALYAASPASDALREALEELLRASDSVTVFVTSRKRIKKPEGEGRWSNARESARRALASQERAETGEARE